MHQQAARGNLLGFYAYGGAYRAHAAVNVQNIIRSNAGELRCKVCTMAQDGLCLLWIGHQAFIILLECAAKDDIVRAWNDVCQLIRPLFIQQNPAKTVVFTPHTLPPPSIEVLSTNHLPSPQP